jgi:lipoprotein-anchoring transpeptidase ErfK/SrfK
MLRFLPVVILVLIVTFLFSFLPTRRYLAYKFHFDNDPTTSCCNVENVLGQSGAFDESSSVAVFNGQPVDYPKTSLAEADTINPESNVLGTTNSAGEEKWIDVSLSQQRLRAYEGNKVVMEFPISSGLWHPTPTGTFNIWYKTRYQTMVGGSKDLGTYYNLPNVPNNMFFYQGFAIHGAYWHNNFGHPMSHGCVNAPLDQAAKLFEWTGPVLASNQNALRATPENPGTRVVVHE